MIRKSERSLRTDGATGKSAVHDAEREIGRMELSVFDQAPELHAVEDVSVIGTRLIAKGRVFIVDLTQRSHVMHNDALNLRREIRVKRGAWFIMIKRVRHSISFQPWHLALQVWQT